MFKKPVEYKNLTRTNKLVYRKFDGATMFQKQKMLSTLEKQLKNLELLYKLMLEH